MKNKSLISGIIVLSAILVSSFIIIGASAQNESEFEKIQYPIAELGNCQNKEDCKIFCDKPENLKPCLEFAKNNNLMSAQELQTAEKFAKAGNGPGGCKSKQSCEKYCDSIDRINECVEFAEKNNLMPPKQLEEAKKIKAAIERGVKPPACKNKSECDVYCTDVEHMEECITFAQEAGFMDEKEMKESKQVLEAVKKGIKPPPCKGKEACDKYCSDESHFQECITFAEAAGFMSKEELEMAKKTGGKGPGGCRGKEECDAFCQKEENMNTCAEFAMQYGLMKPEEAEMFKKTGGKGPNGCKSKEECETFCNNPDNQQTCMDFAKEHNMIPENELKNMEEGKQKFQGMMNQAPSEVVECLKSTVGAEQVEKFKSGQAMPSRDLGDKMRTCFEQFGGPQGPNNGQNGPMGPNQGQNSPIMMGPGTAGPGNCKSPDECKAYCESHQEECKNFTPPSMMGSTQMGPGGPMMGQPGEPVNQVNGPGGCKSPEECKNYCQSNPNECQNFAPPAGTSQQGIQAMPPCQGENCQQMPFNPMMAPSQIQQQMMQQYGPLPEGMQMMGPPSSGYPPPPGMQMPPEGMMNPPPLQEGQTPPPPDSQMPPSVEPPPAPAPQTLISPNLLLGLIINFANLLFGR